MVMIKNITTQQQFECLYAAYAQRWNKLRYIENLFYVMDINLHVNGVRNQGSVGNFVK